MVGALLMCACHEKKHRTDNEVTRNINRLEQVLFATDTTQLQRVLLEQRDIYSSPLLNVHPENMQFMAQVKDFVSDPTMRMFYNVIDSIFNDIQWLENDLNDAIENAHKLCNELDCYRVYTMISGALDYDSRVFSDGNDMVICLDQYVLPLMQQYAYFGLPWYIANLCRPQYIVSDCMNLMVKNHIALPNEQPTMLDYMIMEGKALYVVDQILPETDDTIIMRYTQDQWDWMTQNEGNVWGYMIQNKMLYENDYMRFHNFVEEAPQTNCFRDSAPRTGPYIGWQIVKQYMKKNKVSISELLINSNSQEILKESGYRP